MTLIILASACVSTGPPTTPTGTLQVDITGLPAGIAADVTVTGPNSFSRSLTATATLDELAVGSYTVTAQPVGDYRAGVTGSPAEVTDGGTATVSVVYAIPAVSVSVEPTSTTIQQGDSSTLTVTVTKTGFTTKVILIASDLPPGVTAIFDPQFVIREEVQSQQTFTSTLTLDVDVAADVGTDLFTITAVAADIGNAAVSVSLTIDPATTP